MDIIERKKVFSTLEKELFLNIIHKYNAILTSKQTNATSALKKKQTWDTVTEEFNNSAIVTQMATTKQLTKLWYNMKAKARESKTKENVKFLTGGGPPVTDMDPIDSKVMDIDKNILTYITVDVDSDIDGTKGIMGDTNDYSWSKINDVTINMENECDNSRCDNSKPDEKKIKKLKDIVYSNKIDELKCEILEEELSFKKRLHEEELRIKTLEREHKEKLFEIEELIKLKELEKYG